MTLAVKETVVCLLWSFHCPSNEAFCFTEICNFFFLLVKIPNILFSKNKSKEIIKKLWKF